MNQNIIMRAFELAQSGLYPTLTHLKAQLKHERYSRNEVEPHLAGKLIQTQLKAAIAASAT